MDTIQTFQNLDITKIQNYLTTCDMPFESSQLYSSKRDEKFVDKDLRKSVFRAIVDPTLFDLVEGVVQNLNQGNDNGYQFMLRKNDITHIKYETGGFFKRHRDFLSTTSNLIQEFTLIICVTPDELAQDVQGGETSVFTYGGLRSGSHRAIENTFDTVTPGVGLLFRKDMEHAGKELKQGVKHIVTANIWATRTTQSDQVLLVTFPDDQDSTESQNDSASRAMEKVSSAHTSYVLSIDVLSGMLLTHVQWANRKAADQDLDAPRVITYECHDFCYDAFGVVYNIMNKAYINEFSIESYQTCLDYFGPFNTQDILVDLAVVEHEEEEEPQLKRSKHEDKPPQEEVFDQEVIVCENEARMQAVLNVAKIFNLPYVPFKMLFVEGDVFLEGECTGGDYILEGELMQYGDAISSIQMTPAACLLGDYNNIFSLWKICRKSNFRQDDELTLKQMYDECSYEYYKQFPMEQHLVPGMKVTKFEQRTEDCETSIDGGDYSGLCLGLQWGFDVEDSEVKDEVMQSTFRESSGICRDDKALTYLPGNTTEADTSISGQKSLFHRDAQNKIAFTSQEAELASQYVASMGLDQRVKAALQKKRFDLPQELGLVEGSFCNENVYGKVNILWVTGVVRMEDTTVMPKPRCTCHDDEFNAWPELERQIMQRENLQEHIVDYRTTNPPQPLR